MSVGLFSLFGITLTHDFQILVHYIRLDMLGGRFQKGAYFKRFGKCYLTLFSMFIALLFFLSVPIVLMLKEGSRTVSGDSSG